MENPDVELVLERDEKGKVTRMALKVGEQGPEGRTALEFCDMAAALLKAEGPGDKNLYVDANITVAHEVALEAE